jgi:hypothetical protein
MTVEEMRRAIIKSRPTAERFHKQLAKMNDKQIIAIFLRMKKSGELRYVIGN